MAYYKNVNDMFCANKKNEYLCLRSINKNMTRGMKKYMKQALLALIVAFSAVAQLHAGNEKQTTMYAFAYGICFNDSVVYLSSVARLNQVSVDGKTKFLNNRSFYVSAFKRYLEEKYSKPYTCALFFSTKRDKLEKKYLKVKRIAQKEKTTRLMEVPITDFDLSTTVIWDENVQNESEQK